MYYAKESDYTAYNVWELKYLKSIADIIECGARETIEYISPDLKQSLVYSNKEWFVCDSNTNLWKRCNKPDLYFQIDLISRIDDYIKELVENKPDKYDESIINCMKIKKSIDKNGYQVPVFEVKVTKDIVLFDQNKDLLDQENKVISVDGVNGKEIILGSMSEVSTSGNWPTIFDAKNKE